MFSERGNGGHDDLDLFRAEPTILSRMGIETRYREPRSLDAEIRSKGLGNNDTATNDGFDGKTPGNVRQGAMHRYRDGPQARSGKHHDRIRLSDVTRIGEELRLASEAKTRSCQIVLGDGRGDDASDFLVQRQSRCYLQRPQSKFGPFS